MIKKLNFKINFENKKLKVNNLLKTYIKNITF